MKNAADIAALEESVLADLSKMNNDVDDENVYALKRAKARGCSIEGSGRTSVRHKRSSSLSAVQLRKKGE